VLDENDVDKIVRSEHGGKTTPRKGTAGAGGRPRRGAARIARAKRTARRVSKTENPQDDTTSDEGDEVGES